MQISPKYEVTATLGEGGMGVVYLATQTELGHKVAVKVLRQEAAKDAETVQRFHREARIAAQLKSSHAARVLDFGTTPAGHPFMVMEYLEGNDLDEELSRRGALPMAEAIDYVLQACEALREAHDLGVVHRDLKPSNFFLANEAGKRKVKLLDFGISKLASEEQLRVTKTQSSFGTPLYMSPEHMRSAKSVDKRTDIWSLGVILYELVTGMPPFVADSATAVAVAVATEHPPPPSAQVPGLPAELDRVIMRALEKDPAKRYPDVDELVADLTRAMGLPAPRASALPPRVMSDAATQRVLTTTPNLSAARSSRSRTPLLLVGGIVAGLVVAGVFALALRGGERGAARPEQPAAPTEARTATGTSQPELTPTPSTAAPSAEPTADPAAVSSAEPPSRARAVATQKPATKAPRAPQSPTGTAKPATEPPKAPPVRDPNRDSQGRPIVL